MQPVASLFIASAALSLQRSIGSLRYAVRLAVCAFVVPAGAQPNAEPSAFDLSIEDLGQIRVTTASRRDESLDVTPAAVYVITAEDIRRSGVTTIQDALRLAPGVEVARNGSHSWTISIRGFSNDLSNKLLVLIDGRSVYSPLYAGVFWDVQDVLLADVERIEVVAGPGGTVWGANAVNGVINIITNSAPERQGLVRRGWRGQRGGKLRGGALRVEARRQAFWTSVFAKTFDRDAAKIAATGADANDDWRLSHGGFLLTWQPDVANRLNVRTDIYDGNESILARGTFTLGTLPATNIPSNGSREWRQRDRELDARARADASWGLQF